MNLVSANYAIDMFDTEYFGLEQFFPDDDPTLVLLSASEIRIRDRETGATVSLFGNFVFQDRSIADGTATRMSLKTTGGEVLLELSGFSLSVLQALEDDTSVFFGGNDVITGSIEDDVLLGFEGNDLVRGGGKQTPRPLCLCAGNRRHGPGG